MESTSKFADAEGLVLLQFFYYRSILVLSKPMAHTDMWLQVSLRGLLLSNNIARGSKAPIYHPREGS